MRKLTATLCLTFAVILGSEVRGSDLPRCWHGLDYHNCFGTYTWANGGKYVGEFRDNKRHGWGTFTYGASSYYAGDKYVGEWEYGKKNGKGTYIPKNGEITEGIWKNGTFQGEITEGTWKNGKFQYAEKVSSKEHSGTSYAIANLSDSGICKFAHLERSAKGREAFNKEAKRRNIVCPKVSPTVTARKSSPPSKSAAEKENERLRKEIARLKKENQSRPKQVAKKPSPKKSSKPQVGSTGSGFFVSKLGHILTNEHVVRKCGSVTVGDNANNQVAASVLEKDKRNDLALLSISSTKMASAETKSLISKLNVKKLGIKIVPLASGGLMRSDDIELGERVLVAGFPYGELYSNTIKVTGGMVSSVKGMGDDSAQFQMDAAVQPGNSGGPIYDENGNIVGVVIAQLDKRKFERTIGSLPENVNFGIKASTVRQFLTSAGLPTKWSNRTEQKSTKELAQIAKNQTVMVVCNP